MDSCEVVFGGPSKQWDVDCVRAMLCIQPDSQVQPSPFQLAKEIARESYLGFCSEVTIDFALPHEAQVATRPGWGNVT